MADGDRTVERRTLLHAGAGIAAGAASGCTQRARSLLDRRPRQQISLTIKTLPADSDRAATSIARTIADNLDAVGIEASVVPMTRDELRRDVLVDHAFDVSVMRHQGSQDPDFLRPLLHSKYAEEPGWQNPFGFTEPVVDDLLDRQRRRAGAARQNAVFDLQREIARRHPFVVVGLPDDIRAARTDRFVGWTSAGLGEPLGYLRLGRRGEETAREEGDLVVAATDDRMTKNLNPLAVEFRNRGTFSGLLYDPLGRRYGGAIHPWLARSWDWESNDGETTATVHLRENVAWHDGSPLTPRDVAFTYRFMIDTSLGEMASPSPAPRFRGRTTLVDAVEVVGERTLRFRFGTTSREVAERTFTIPILPRHEWEPKAVEADIAAGIDLRKGVTEALVWANPEPVGSGPFAFDRSVAGETLVLERFDDHFLDSAETAEVARLRDEPAMERLIVRVAPSDSAAVELAEVGRVDATASNVAPEVVPRVGRSDALQLLVSPSRSFYHVGFNTRDRHLSNFRFRRAVARLIDRIHLIDRVFDGYATPTVTPLGGTYWTPVDLRWNETAPVAPFAGRDGRLDASAARDAFREAGYRYGDDGALIER